MFLDQIFLSLVAFFLIYDGAVLEALGFNVGGFAESDEVPWYLDTALSIWIIIAMLISIKMMIKRSGRLVIEIYRALK